METTSCAVQLDRPYGLHPSVAVRPEPFGALVYHYGNRKLVFLKSPRLVTLVRSLAQQPTVEHALSAAAVPASAHPRYVAALQSLLDSDMIVASSSDPGSSAHMVSVSMPSEGTSHGTAG